MREHKQSSSPKAKVVMGAGVVFVALAFTLAITAENIEPLWYKIVLFLATAAVIITVTALGVVRIERHQHNR